MGVDIIPLENSGKQRRHTHTKLAVKEGGECCPWLRVTLRAIHFLAPPAFHRCTSGTDSAARENCHVEKCRCPAHVPWTERS